MATSSKKSSKSSSKKTSKYAGLKGDALKRKFFSQSPVGAQGLTVEQRVQGASVNRTKNADGSYSYSKPGKFVSDGKGGDSFQEFQGGAIPTDTMGATTPAVPTFQQQDMGFTGINTAMQTAAIPAEPLTPLETSQDNVTKLFQDYLGGKQDAFNSRESEQSLYNQAQRETGILAKQEEATRLQNQLGQIQAQGQANQLKVVGQGRGIPEAIIGGQQAQIGRETAIASLPVAASLAAAQGDVEMAQQNLETLFKIKSADAKAEFDYNTEVVQAVYEFGSAQEKAKLDEINKQEERRYKETQVLNEEAQSYAKMAFSNGQSKLGSQIASLDYKSPTFKNDLAKLQSQLRDPVRDMDVAIKSAQLKKLNQEISAVTVDSPVQQKVDATIVLKGLISDLASGSGKSGAVGFGLQKLIPGFLKSGEDKFLPGTKPAGYETTFNQLKDTLAFENISKLKGAMSDKDIQFLRNIGTKLSLGMSEEEFNKELQKLDTTMNQVLIKNGVDPSQISIYSSLSNEDLLSSAQQDMSNSNFFNK